MPILFLKADNHPWQENWLDEITPPIEEAGWVVDAWQGTIDEVVERVRDDWILPGIARGAVHLGGTATWWTS